MSNFISRLFHQDGAEYPVALLDQYAGRLSYGEKEVDLAARPKTAQDRAADDGYGFYSSALQSTKH